MLRVVNYRDESSRFYLVHIIYKLKKKDGYLLKKDVLCELIGACR